jgi:hypothetical protein
MALSLAVMSHSQRCMHRYPSLLSPCSCDTDAVAITRSRNPIAHTKAVRKRQLPVTASSSISHRCQGVADGHDAGTVRICLIHFCLVTFRVGIAMVGQLSPIMLLKIITHFHHLPSIAGLRTRGPSKSLSTVTIMSGRSSSTKSL